MSEWKRAREGGKDVQLILHCVDSRYVTAKDLRRYGGRDLFSFYSAKKRKMSEGPRNFLEFTRNSGGKSRSQKSGGQQKKGKGGGGFHSHINSLLEIPVNIPGISTSNGRTVNLNHFLNF